MGDPKKFRKKFSGPNHPWNKVRIEEERVLKKEFGLKNKEELWRATSLAKKFSDGAKRLIALHGAQAEVETKNLFSRLRSLGLIGVEAKLDDVLALTVKNILERRLQTLVVRRKLARTVSQARQFITHEHIVVGGKKVTSPSYLVPVNDEGKIHFTACSTLASDAHPERVIEAVEVKHEKTSHKQ